MGDPGRDLAEKLQPLCREVWRHERPARDVASGPRQAGDEPGLHWVEMGQEDDGDRRRCAFRRHDGGIAPSDDDLDLEPDEILGEDWESPDLPLSPPGLELNVLAIGIPELPKTVTECAQHGAASRGGIEGKPADTRDPACLRRPCGERCAEEAAGDG